MKKMRWLALLLALAMVAAACGSDDTAEDSSGGGDTEEPSDTTDSGGDEEEAATDAGDEEEAVDLTQGSDLTFYMITHSDDGPFWSVLKRGAEAAAEDVGVELVWQGSNNDANVQAEFIDAAVAAGADGIAASLPNVDALTNAFDRTEA